MQPKPIGRASLALSLEEKSKSFMADTAKDWQLRLYQKTLKKKEKVGLLSGLMPSLEGLRCLDLGCSAGTVSYWMRRLGGSWVSVDLDEANLITTRRLVEDGVVRVGPRVLPFVDGAFEPADLEGPHLLASA